MKKNNQHFYEDQAEPRLLTIFGTFEFFYKRHRGIMSSAKITYIFLHKIGGGGEGGREGGRKGGCHYLKTQHLSIVSFPIEATIFQLYPSHILKKSALFSFILLH